MQAGQELEVGDCFGEEKVAIACDLVHFIKVKVELLQGVGQIRKKES